MCSTDGQSILTGSHDGTALLWDVQSGRTILVFDGQDLRTSTISAGFSPDGQTIISASWDGHIALWNAHNGQLKKEFIVDPSKISGVALTADGQSFLTYGAGFSPREDLALTASSGNMARLLDYKSGQESADSPATGLQSRVYPSSRMAARLRQPAAMGQSDSGMQNTRIPAAISAQSCCVILPTPRGCNMASGIMDQPTIMVQGTESIARLPELVRLIESMRLQN